jgi:hypothetical protein
VPPAPDGKKDEPIKTTPKKADDTKKTDAPKEPEKQSMWIDAPSHPRRFARLVLDRPARD